MRWDHVAETVGKVAPVIGGALGGPAGAAVGGLAARVLGIGASPDELIQALGDPDKAAKLRQIEQDHEREILSLTIEGERAQLAEINKTMRAELQADGWFKSGWRPALGWIFAGSLGAFAGAMVLTVVRDPHVVGDSEFTGMLIWLFVTMGGALGLNVHERSKDKAMMLGKAPKTFMDAIKNPR